MAAPFRWARIPPFLPFPIKYACSTSLICIYCLAPVGIWFWNPWAKRWKDFISLDIWEDSQDSSEYSHKGSYLKGEREKEIVGKNWTFKRHPGTLPKVLLILIWACLQIKPPRSVQEIFTLGDLKAEVPRGIFLSLWFCGRARLTNQLWHWKPWVNKLSLGITRGVSDFKQHITNLITLILAMSQSQMSRCPREKDRSFPVWL